jgi:L-ascorbate metabolism protein UlaG (beta-lactamase superfamily)
MKITRYFQSCLLVEEGNSRILIDPSGAEAGRLNKFGKLDAVFYTHEHADHFDAPLCEQLRAAGAIIHANASTAKLIKGDVKIVHDREEFSAGSLGLKAIELPHCLMPDGSKGPQNTGYLINKKLFHPGDGVELMGFEFPNLALPIAGPDVSIKDALAFAKDVKANKVIPIHYDYIGVKPEVVASFAKNYGFSFEIITLGIGDSTEI